jgi:hypothetical protein
MIILLNNSQKTTFCYYKYTVQNTFNYSSVLYEQAVQLKGGKYFLRNVTAIRPEWLLELAPQYFNNLRKMINPELAQLLPSTTANGNDDCSGWDQAMSNDNW